MGIVGRDWSRAVQRAQNAPWKRGRELKAEKQGEGGVKGNGLFNVARTAMGNRAGAGSRTVSLGMGCVQVQVGLGGQAWQS